MITELSPVEILIKTKETLKARGWFQGNMVEPRTDNAGRVCFIGAMNVAIRGNPHDCGIEQGPISQNETIAFNAVKDITKEYLVKWNDNPKRTISEVNQAIDQAIIQLESKV